MNLDHLPDLAIPLEYEVMYPQHLLTSSPASDSTISTHVRYDHPFLRFLREAHAYIRDIRDAVRSIHVYDEDLNGRFSDQDIERAIEELKLISNPEVGDFVFPIHIPISNKASGIQAHGLSRILSVETRLFSNTSEAHYNVHFLYPDTEDPIQVQSPGNYVFVLKSGLLDIFARHYPQVFMPPQVETPSPLS